MHEFAAAVGTLELWIASPQNQIWLDLKWSVVIVPPKHQNHIIPTSGMPLSDFFSDGEACISGSTDPRIHNNISIRVLGGE